MNILAIALTNRVLRNASLFMLAVGIFGYCWLQSRPHVYPDAPSGEFNCLSYTPRSDSSRGAQPDIHAQIDRDLKQLSARTHCVRTYSVLNGLDYVPTAARKLNMRVLLGIWIGSNADANETELAKAIETANANRDVIDAIVVGNEVLLRREQTAEAMSDYLTRVRNATQLPVTYADVWDFWLKNPSLAASGDFVTIHILPYWDDIPIGIDQAMQHVEDIFNKVQAAFPDKRIYVGEVGWPSAGRQREAAEPSLLNQARFTREFIAFASSRNISYNFIEAYDQPWKRRLEGTVGGYWGLYDADGNAKFPLTGPVIADADWWRGWVAGSVGGLALFVISVLRRRTPAQHLEASLLGACLTALAVMQWDYLWLSNRDWLEWLAMGAMKLLVTSIVLLEAVTDSPRALRWRGALWLLLLIALAYINLGLVFDARYRDFPTVFVLLPAVLLLCGEARMSARLQGAYALLSAWLCLAPLIIVAMETLANRSALLWSGACLASGLRLVWLAFHGRSVYQEQRTQ
jgi:exo-beta-1,3-glucanase (GH17 family)